MSESILQTITAIISIIGLILSLWNFFKDIKDNRYRLTVYCNNCEKATIGSDSAIRMYLAFQNHSLSSLSVSQMYLIHKNEKYKFEHQARIVLIESYKSSDNVTNKTHSSSSIPFQISSLGAHGGYFYVNINNAELTDYVISKDFCIELHTCRGTKTEKVKFS